METKVQSTPLELTLVIKVRPCDGLHILATCSWWGDATCSMMNVRPVISILFSSFLFRLDASATYFPHPSGRRGYLTLPHHVYSLPPPVTDLVPLYDQPPLTYSGRTPSPTDQLWLTGLLRP